MALACMPSTVVARGGVVKGAALRLETMSFADAERAGAVGTGCTWLLPGDRAGRLAMADGRAAVRRDGAVVALSPAPDAKPLFLTYDRWVGGGMRLRLHDTGRIVRREREYTRTVATLELAVDGRTGVWSGWLDCGS